MNFQRSDISSNFIAFVIFTETAPWMTLGYPQIRFLS